MKHARGFLTLVMVIMAVTGLTLAGGLWTKADALSAFDGLIVTPEIGS